MTLSNLSLNQQEQFNYFLLSKIQNKLSGTSTMSFTEIDSIKQSIQFVLNHSSKKTTDIAEQFSIGKKVIQNELNGLQEEVFNIKKLNIFPRSEAYQKTFDELSIFFKSYDLDYQATELGAASFDYQLAHPINDIELKGIDFIRELVTSLKKEALFVNQLPEQMIQEILIAYQKRLSVDYKIDINNLYQLIFNQVIAKFLVNEKMTSSILLTQAEKNYLLSSTKKELPKNILQWINSDTYYQKSYKELLVHINRGLINFLLFQSPNKDINKMNLTEKMSDKKYLLFIKKLERLTGYKRIYYLVNNLYSPFDLSEILETFYFSEDDLKKIITKLPKEILFQYLLYLKQQTGNQITSINELVTFGIEDPILNYLSCLDEEVTKELDVGLNEISSDNLDLS